MVFFEFVHFAFVFEFELISFYFREK